MIDALFGNMETVTKFFVAFVIVLGLMALSFWLFRRLSGQRLGGGSTRGRQPRLAVIDAAVVDGRRRLVLVRRDNVEHLLMIGGPGDVVIEQNIVRAVPVASARELPPATRGNAEPPSRDSAAGRPDVAPAWPSQPEPPPMREAEVMPRPRPPRAVEPEPMTRPQRLVEPEPMPRPQRLVDPEPMPRAQRLVEPEPLPTVQRAEPVMPRMAATGEPSPRPPLRAAPPMPGPGKPMAEPLRTVEPRAAPATADVNLADMAQRLEAALRRPGPSPDARAADQPARPAEAPAMREAPRPEAARPEAARPEVPRPEVPRPEAARPEPVRPAAPERPRPSEAEIKPDTRSETRPETKTDTRAASPKSVLDSLEQEMASLLGRPTGKE